MYLPKGFDIIRQKHDENAWGDPRPLFSSMFRTTPTYLWKQGFRHLSFLLWVCFSSTFPSFFTLFTHTKMLLARQYTQKENAKMWAKERLYWWALISKKHLFMMLTFNLLDALNTHRYRRCQYITEIYTNTCLISSNLGNQNLAWYERNAWQPTESDPYANFHSSNLIYDILGR